MEEVGVWFDTVMMRSAAILSIYEDILGDFAISFS
jgi:hypothetical protein